MTAQATALPLPAQMLNHIVGYWVSQLIYVAAKLDLGDLLAGGPLTPEELAQRCDARPERLGRCLRALASVGIFAEDDAGRFGHTPLSETLRSDRPDSMRDFALMMVEDFNVSAWTRLLEGVREDCVPFERSTGVAHFDYLAQHPEDEAIFLRSMASISGAENPAVAEAYDFGLHGSLVDVGGSGGHLLAAILGRYPNLRGVLFDQPQVVQLARSAPFLQDDSLSGRLSVEGGDFFQGVPAGHDAYLMKYILHDWDDERCVTLLRHCREAMAEGGRVLVVDTVVEPGNGPQWGKLLDINMLVLTGGKERTEAEFSALFAAAGLALERVVPTACPLSILVARRA